MAARRVRTTTTTRVEVSSDRGVFMISVAAELAEMHPQTLRMYEARGLIEPKRSPKGTRLYSQKDVDRLRRIQEMTAELGMNLAGVERVFELEQELDTMARRGGGAAEARRRAGRRGQAAGGAAPRAARRDRPVRARRRAGAPCRPPRLPDRRASGGRRHRRRRPRSPGRTVPPLPARLRVALRPGACARPGPHLLRVRRVRCATIPCRRPPSSGPRRRTPRAVLQDISERRRDARHEHEEHGMEAVRRPRRALAVGARLRVGGRRRPAGPGGLGPERRHLGGRGSARRARSPWRCRSRPTRGLGALCRRRVHPGSRQYGHYEPVPASPAASAPHRPPRARVLRYLRAAGATSVRIDVTGLFADATHAGRRQAQRLFGTSPVEVPDRAGDALCGPRRRRLASRRRCSRR